jgi:hypothetical protein
MVANFNPARSIAQPDSGAAEAPIPVATGPGSTALDLIPLGP